MVRSKRVTCRICEQRSSLMFVCKVASGWYELHGHWVCDLCSATLARHTKKWSPLAWPPRDELARKGSVRMQRPREKQCPYPGNVTTPN